MFATEYIPAYSTNQSNTLLSEPTLTQSSTLPGLENSSPSVTGQSSLSSPSSVFLTSSTSQPLNSLATQSTSTSLTGWNEDDGTVILPSDSKLKNVKSYGAVGDGITDDTAAIQKALDDGREKSQDYTGRPKALFFPAGTYLVSNTLTWKGASVTIQGEGSGSTILKLKDGATGFSDPNNSKPVLSTPSGNMSFRQNIWDISVNIGKNNPGAEGIDYISNNIGSLRNVKIWSEDGKGARGLDMTRYAPGPSLIKNLVVDGFDYGIRVGNPEYGPTFENIALFNQKIAGIANFQNTLAIRRLESNNTVPVIQNRMNGHIVLLDGKFTGGSSGLSAIDNEGNLYARNVTADGYASVISNKSGIVPGNSVSEYVSGKTLSLFDSPQSSLGLPIEETPSYEDKDLNNWGRFKPRWYGDTDQLQALLNSGKSTIYFPFGVYFKHTQATFDVPATVKRIVGLSSVVNGGGIVFNVSEASDQPLIIEQFGYGVSVKHSASRTVALKDGGYNYTDSPNAGKLFLENVGTKALNITSPRNVWARQLNVETINKPATKITNKGGSLWILGLKTEGRGTVIDTSAGGKTELLGTLIYPTETFSTTDKLQPAFVSKDSSQSLIYSLSVYGSDKNYDIQVQETRDGVTRNLMSKDTGNRIPLFVGYKR